MAGMPSQLQLLILAAALLRKIHQQPQQCSQPTLRSLLVFKLCVSCCIRGLTDPATHRVWRQNRSVMRVLLSPSIPILMLIPTHRPQLWLGRCAFPPNYFCTVPNRKLVQVMVTVHNDPRPSQPPVCVPVFPRSIGTFAQEPLDHSGSLRYLRQHQDTVRQARAHEPAPVRVTRFAAE